jgi:hypothetical protein
MCYNKVQNNLWSDDVVLAFVSVNVWRSFIICQIFRETGSVERSNGSGRSSIRISETVERIWKIKKMNRKLLQQKKV